jgi:hypothetical protein
MGHNGSVSEITQSKHSEPGDVHRIVDNTGVETWG